MKRRNPTAVLRSELLALLASKLDAPLDRVTFDRLVENQKGLRREQRRLVRMLETSRISREGYLDQFTAVLRSRMAENRTILGEERYGLVFGEGDPAGIIDRDLFLNPQIGVDRSAVLD